MLEFVEYRSMDLNEAMKVETLIKSVFDLYIAYDYSEKGVQDFLEYIHYEKLKQRTLIKSHQIILAEMKGELVGMIESRGNDHISLLFVHKDFQRKGIAKNLIGHAFSCQQGDITVNASPYAAPIYEKMGFVKISGELIKNGNTYIPMIRDRKK